ncbi:RagB/SusD family nutrient uptake outer membrane protein [Flavobacterium sp. F-380]|uniref:RagB/SusD family nutrient uptake outer membrane protein n=1 Tax=Flavobacterium kayseriense TaxID=2764714 RepID=A0ABR7J591_9FLAO|nr:RagB/SusD family nutrient uptake outer membrane protein [Flavobacterium kayseriense]MBC5840642.1 RagB/SusD family nutrient uptake outer membrane protein [Flavobacterium kayseriense]MBC5846688.1 RagB/SusD family nutrient uptake outer membrane protein [Flavobacterium kayseriense]
MKNYKNISKVFLLFSLFALTSCEDNLDVENLNKPQADTFYITSSDFNVGLNGCYSTLRAPIAFEWMLTETRSDNTYLNNYGTTNPQNLQVISNDVFEAPTFDFFIEQYWATTYTSIRSINGLATALNTVYNPTTGTIDYVTPTTPLQITDAVRKNTSGQASFLRAYHYFNLVRTYGGVFLIDKVVTPDQALEIPRSSVQDIYKFIIADLQNAVANCSTVRGNDVTTTALPLKGQATKWAAEALLAKVYLTLGRKTDALPLLNDVIAASGHSLITSGTTPYSDVFSASNELNSEIMFAIRFKSGGLGYGSSLSNLFSSTTSQGITGLIFPNGTRGGYNNPTPELYNSYASTDKRRDFNIKTKIVTPVTATSANSQLFWSGKHNIAVAVQNDSELDWPVLRYSDVLLMYCEAVGTPTTLSLGYLNQVRSRAGLTPAISPAAGAAYELAVANERRWEFAMENQRWFDLLRFTTTLPTVNAKTVMKNHFTAMAVYYTQFDTPFTVPQLHAKVDSPKFDLSPIPNLEIVTNTKTPITQNSGY